MNNQIAGVKELLTWKEAFKIVIVIYLGGGGGGGRKGDRVDCIQLQFFYFATFSFRKLNRKLKSNPEFYKKSPTLLSSFQGIYILSTHVVHSIICILRAHIPPCH